MVTNPVVKNKVEDSAKMDLGKPICVPRNEHSSRIANRDWSELNHLFRRGTVPEPSLGGHYDGELVAFDITPGLDPVHPMVDRSTAAVAGKDL